MTKDTDEIVQKDMVFSLFLEGTGVELSLSAQKKYLKSLEHPLSGTIVPWCHTRALAVVSRRNSVKMFTVRELL